METGPVRHFPTSSHPGLIIWVDLQRARSGSVWNCRVCVLYHSLGIRTYIRRFISLAQDTISGENVAIKQVTRVFDKKELAKRALREIVLLRHFNHHENVRLCDL